MKIVPHSQEPIITMIIGYLVNKIIRKICLHMQIFCFFQRMSTETMRLNQLVVFSRSSFVLKMAFTFYKEEATLGTIKVSRCQTTDNGSYHPNLKLGQVISVRFGH